MNHFTLPTTLAIAFLTLISIACATPPTATIETTAPSRSQTIFSQMLEAHGGLDTWRSYRQLDYTIPDFPLGDHAPMNFQHTADLKNRYHRMVGENYRLGFDGKTGWGINPEAAGLPARFVTAGNFYFIAMPFVFADPGVSVRSLGLRTFQGDQYEALAVSYAEDVGDTAEDNYVLFVHPETKRLRLIHFTITYSVVSDDSAGEDLPRTALLFDDWQSVGGLSIPAKATFYSWNNGALQGDGNSFTIINTSFSTQAPSSQLFTLPNDAVIDLSRQSS